MNIQDALKETGKARKIVDTDNYAKLDTTDRLYWHGIDDDCKNSPVQMVSILADNWQPYHPVEQIVPREAGELWESDAGLLCFIVENGGGLKARSQSDTLWEKEGGTFSRLIHNQNGWTRIHPPVKEDVEDIVTEGVEWE